MTANLQTGFDLRTDLTKDRFAESHTKRNDPDSSRIAAEKIFSQVTEHKAIILETIRDYPGRTSKELASCCGLNRDQIARRLKDIEQDGTIFRMKGETSSELTWWPK